jgi:hypothetical protein
MTRNDQAHSFADLDALYRDGETVDSRVFAEQRSNLLIIAGDHYNKFRPAIFSALRSENVSEETRMRLVKNHSQYITGLIVDNIVSAAPGVGFRPQNEKEMADQKKAELHRSVWLDAKNRYGVDDMVVDCAKDYVEIGEVARKIFWDPMGGKVAGYSQAVDEETGAPLFLGYGGTTTTDQSDEWGRPLPPAPDWNSPVFEGAFVFEKIYGFNLLRPSECTDIREAEWLCIRKMVRQEILLSRYQDKAKFINTTTNQTFTVFDGQSLRRQGANEVLVREFYFRPCVKYPRGYFYIATMDGILEEGELPGGIFPIAYRAYERSQTSARGYGPIRALRPYQMEINRTASKIAEHQMSVGDDKIISQTGTKVAPGISMPGIRHITVSGMDPKILPGRDGSQFVGHMTGQISEMYQVAGLKEELEELPAQLDPMVLLFRAARQKKRFSRHIRGFESFLVDVAKIYLALAKLHLPEDMFIKAAGRSEAVNMAEFKNSDDIGYEIRVEGQSDDVETKLGRQLQLNHLLQYVGNKLERDDLGRILKLMPYGNIDGAFDRFTLKDDKIQNDILALDRGENPPMGEYDDHGAYYEALTFRMSQPDFRFLHPDIQSNYEQHVQAHATIKTEQMQELERAKQGFIPTSGQLITISNYHVPDPANPENTKALRLPVSALEWLRKQLEAQGEALDQLEELPMGAQAHLAAGFNRSQHATPDPMLQLQEALAM